MYSIHTQGDAMKGERGGKEEEEERGDNDCVQINRSLVDLVGYRPLNRLTVAGASVPQPN